jgi:uncharacterized protein HemX
MALTPDKNEENKNTTSQPANNTKGSPTGYRILDAVVFVFGFLFDNTRRDVSATFISILILFAVSGWGFVVWIFVKSDKSDKEQFDKYKIELQKEKEGCDRERQILRDEYKELRDEYGALEEVCKDEQKENSKKINELYERLLKINKR